MNKLQKILTSLTPEFEYRVKFAMEPTTEDMAKITARLTDRYDAVDIGPLTKLIFQEKPLDFYELDCGEIWMFDFTCNRGVQTEVLRYEIGNLLKWTEAYIKIRNKGEPLEMAYEEEAEDIDFDEYDTILGEPFGEPEPDAQELAGQSRAEVAVKDALDNLEKKKSNNFAKYLAAGYKGKKE